MALHGIRLLWLRSLAKDGEMNERERGREEAEGETPGRAVHPFLLPQALISHRPALHALYIRRNIHGSNHSDVARVALLTTNRRLDGADSEHYSRLFDHSTIRHQIVHPSCRFGSSACADSTAEHPATLTTQAPCQQRPTPTCGYRVYSFQ